METKRAVDLRDGDTIGVSAERLCTGGKGFFRLPIIRRQRLGEGRWAIHTPGGVIQCRGTEEFTIVPPLEMHTDTLTPQMPTKRPYKGRTID
jgi:hypothetical protein